MIALLKIIRCKLWVLFLSFIGKKQWLGNCWESLMYFASMNEHISDSA